MSRRSGALAGAVLLAATALPVLAAAGAAGAAGTELYVDNAASAHCSDGGQGAQAQPFCTVSAAANVVQPGQTVHIAKGEYHEQVTLTRSGTAEAPITFAGAGAVGVLWDQKTEVGDTQAAGSHAFLLQGVQHVRLTGMMLTAGSESVLVDGGSDVTVTHSVPGGSFTVNPNTAAIRVTGGASGVQIVRNSAFNSAGFLKLDPGVKDTLVSTNIVPSRSVTALVADGATGTVIVSNTFSADCQDAVSLTGASPGTVVENNVVSTSDANNHQQQPCAQAGSLAGLRVDAAAAAGTKVAYNAFDDRDGSPAYNWAGTPYSTVAEFAAASGQGGNDRIGNTEVQSWKGDSGGTASPVVDSADENAPGMVDTDALGVRPTDDPWVPDTGTGSGHRDRGAVELANFGAYYTPVGPVRVLDTRTGSNGAAVPAGGSVDLQLTGANGLPASGVTAVSMNITVTAGTAPGYLTVYPHGDDRPVVSSLNWTPGQTIPNLVTVQVRDGKVTLYNGSAGTVHLVADLLGFYSTSGSGFHATSPARLLDTRTTESPIAPGGSLDLQLVGVQGIPADLTAVTLNVTATQPTGAGFLTVYPAGGVRPMASSLNWTAGATVPNLVTVPVKDGKVTLYNGSWGTVHVVADLAGYFTASGGDKFHAAAPHRVVDTRYPWFLDGIGEWQPAKPVDAQQGLQVRVDGSGATSVAMNVTVTGGTAPGYLTVYPLGSDRPVASNLNWTAGQTIANSVVAAPDAYGQVVFYNGSGGPVQVIADVSGYYAP
ncbi:hypothetical protein ABT095_07420 [Kitasatospora sp. NPDC002227]|uniref:hypothetical protein n=1 Tax=Kitasatospora sp. NPDC002227 TaxID=3154773 RepID=UPI00332DF926